MPSYNEMFTYLQMVTHPIVLKVFGRDLDYYGLGNRRLHGNGDGRNTAVTTFRGNGSTFTVIPWGRGHVSRGYRGDEEQCRW